MDDSLRQIIETNFRLLSLSLREVAGRTETLGGSFEQTQKSLEQTQKSLAQTQRSLEETQRQVHNLTRSFDQAIDLAIANRDQLEAAADRLDSAVEAIGLLAVGVPENRKRISSIEGQVKDLVARVERLEETG